MAMEVYRCGGGLLRGDDGIELLQLLTNSVADVALSWLGVGDSPDASLWQTVSAGAKGSPELRQPYRASHPASSSP